MSKSVEKMKTRAQWAKEICAIHTRTVQAVLEMGRKLIEAKQGKNKLSHGEFVKMIENDLPFGARTAQRLMAIAADPKLRPNGSLLPSSWRTLYELTKVPAQTFEEAVASGAIHPEMTRSAVTTVRGQGTIGGGVITRGGQNTHPIVPRHLPPELIEASNNIVQRNPVGKVIFPITPLEARLRQVEDLIEEMKELVEHGDKVDAALVKRVRIVGSQLLTMANRIKQDQLAS